MNESIEKPSGERKRGIVKDFGSLDLDTLTLMKKELQLSMSVGQLSACSAQFRDRERREPTLDEIYFFDAWFAGARFSPATVAPDAVETEDAFLADLFADFYARRTASNPDLDTPATLAEIVQTAADAVRAYDGAERARALLSLTASPLPTVGCRPLCEPIPTGNDIAAAILPLGKMKAPEPITAGDDFFLLPLPTDRVAARRCFSDPVFLAPLKLLLTTDSRGVLPVLLFSAKGLYIDLDALCDTNAELESLASAGAGCVLFALPDSAAETIVARARSYGLSPVVFAKSIPSEKLTVRRAGHTILSVDTAFLRRIGTRRRISVEMACEPPAIPPLPTPVVHSVIADPTAGGVPNTEYLSATLSLRQPQFPCHAVIGAVMAATAAAVAGGADPATLLLQVEGTLPLNDDNNDNDTKRMGGGAALAAVLGLYRAQLSLVLPASGCRLKAGNDFSLSITVCGRADTLRLPETMHQPGMAYALCPQPTKEGIPDLPDFAALLRYLHHARTCGNLSAIRVAPTTESTRPEETLSAFLGQPAGILPHDWVSSYDGTVPSPFCFLVGSPRPLTAPGAILLGKTTEEKNQQAPPENSADLRRRAAASPTLPRALFLGNGQDALRALLSRAGFLTARTVPNLTADLPPEVSILVIADADGLRDTPAWHHALASLLARRGFIIASCANNLQKYFVKLAAEDSHVLLFQNAPTADFCKTLLRYFR